LHPVAIETAARATRRLKLSMERAVQQLREHAGRNKLNAVKGLENFDAEADPPTSWGRPPSSRRKAGVDAGQ